MTLEHLWLVREVKFVYINCWLIGDCKKMTSMWKLNLATLLDLNVFVWEQSFFIQIHHSDTLVKSNHNMETAWMESNIVGFFFKKLIDLKSKTVLSGVRPHFNCAIDWSCCNKWLFDTWIHAVYSTGMERHYQIAIVHFVCRSLHRDCDLDDLLVIGWKDKLIFSRT